MMGRSVLLLLAAAVLLAVSTRASAHRKLASLAEPLQPNEHTVIGVLTQPRTQEANWTASYFAASYAQYAAMSGARAAPVICDTPLEDLKALYDGLNGLVVPGAYPLQLCCLPPPARQASAERLRFALPLAPAALGLCSSRECLKTDFRRDPRPLSSDLLHLQLWIASCSCSCMPANRQLRLGCQATVPEGQALL